MRFPYRPLTARRPVATLAGALVRYKPIFRVRLEFANRFSTVSALLDTGSDDTVFPRSVAEDLQLPLDGLPVCNAAGVGKGTIPYAVAEVAVLLGEGPDSLLWNAAVGFRLDRARAFPLLGHAGFLQFFTAEFRGDTHDVILTPNASFPGRIE